MSNTSIRALMAQEQQSRRIAHEFATYNRNVLSCTACHLNIKSETLWDGHLRSANHRANAKKAHATPRPTGKRKVDDMEEVQIEQEDVRKKSRSEGKWEEENGVGDGGSQDRKRKVDVEAEEGTGEVARVDSERKRQRVAIARDADVDTDTDGVHVTSNTNVDIVHPPEETQPAATTATVDESEWAAFERDIASLAQTDYSSATITAAPVSAAQLEAEAEADRKRLRDTEAEDEKEDEGRRMVEEFDVMEEMEERVRKLREKREALRAMGTEIDQSAVVGGLNTDTDTGQGDAHTLDGQQDREASEQATDESDEDVDDWYS